FAKLLNTTEPEIDLRDVVTKGRIAVFGLAADMYPSDYKVLSTMILMDLHSCLTARYQSRSHRGFFLYLDEVADLVYPRFRDLVAKAREAKVGLIFAHQALGDLRAVSEAFMDSILASSANKAIFRLGTSDTAEQFAKLIGTKTVVERKINYSLKHDNDPKAKGYTDQEYEKFLVHPNELRNLPVGEAVFIVQRRDGRRLYKARTFKREDLQALDAMVAEDWMLHRRPEKKSYKPLALEAPPFRPAAPIGEKKSALSDEVMSLVSGKSVR
ncbi:MAG TPA: TraM recognition domain-containing protein, partial [bacterium]|nr:TraM recognition domain-containing protein [bacterium]